MSAPQLVGLLLAAGKGTRMGRTKQLIEIPCAGGETKPLVAAAFDSIAWACQQMVVVVDHDQQLVIESLGQRSFLVAEATGTRQMSESIRTGLRLVTAEWPAELVLMQLGDHPQVQEATVHRLCDESKNFPGHAIIPTWEGRGGHPILIHPGVTQRLLSEPTIEALNLFWRTQPDLCVRCEVGDASIVRDLDNPAELADELQQRSHSKGEDQSDVHSRGADATGNRKMP